MVTKKNFGPCSVDNCTYRNVSFRLITELAYQKCQKENTLETYPYLEIGKQLCHLHYCKIVESNRNRNKKRRLKSQECSRKKVTNEEEALYRDPTFASNIKILTTVLFNKQRRESAGLELDPVQFQLMIEDANPELKGFFPSMVNAIIPKDRSEYNKQEAKKSIVALCYIIAGLRNKFVNQFKTEVGLYLVASGATWEAIDTLSSIGYSACAKTVMDYQKKIQLNHITKIEDHFLEKGDCLHIYNIDDYHDIHEKRRPDTVTTSTAKHFSTCVAKPVMECFAVPIVFNGVSVHNPNNVEAPRICWYLLNKYTGNFDITYTERQIYWISQGYQNANTFDRIELLTIHCYDDAIAERKDERSMKDLQLIGFKEQHLHSMQNYLNALQMILTISRKTEYLDNYVAPIVADWPADHDPIFKDTFRKTRNYSYNLSTLKFLSDKTSLFLLNYFRNIFHNQNNSTPLYNNTRKKEKKLRGYKLATLGKEVDLRHLPTAYSTSYLPKSGLCDNCGLPLNNNGVVLACGHGYHPVCYGRRCVYCENFYKKGIFENVNSFLKRVEKGTDTLTQDDLDDEINEEEEEESEETADEEIDVSATLEAAINNINYW
ncbi:unnamed protein product [Rhizophagus irregularis]|nr:unnamed protein product [Rhizophagus irregularis]